MYILRKFNIRKQVIGENLLYAIIWVCVLLVPFMNAGLMSEDFINIRAALLSWLKVVPFFLLFLINNAILHRYLYQKRRRLIYWSIVWTLILLIFLSLHIYEGADHIGVTWPFGLVEQGAARLHISLTVFPWWGNILAAFLMVMANNVVKAMYRSMQADEDSERLQRQNIEAEMHYLRHQINPHFLMNSLNNIHALVDIDAEMSKKAIRQLSDMMRYVVYDTGEDAISLNQDIRFIEDYIELMRIRYPDDLDITFAYPQNLDERIKVPPLIFIVFVENAFKHGVSYSEPSYIHCLITYVDGYVNAYFENSLHPNSNVRKAGIGMENVRKRLALIYGKEYSLTVEEKSNEKYCVTLKIPTINDKMHRNRR